MPDLLDRIREEISTRLAALRPLMEEHSRLRAAMQALGEAPQRSGRERRGDRAPDGLRAGGHPLAGVRAEPHRRVVAGDGDHVGRGKTAPVSSTAVIRCDDSRVARIGLGRAARAALAAS